MTGLDIPAIKAAVPLSEVIGRYLKLTKAGREWKACCPFHADSNPSFTVSDAKGFYHCFVCPAHGDALDFIQAIERIGLRQAAERIANLPSTEVRQPPELVRDTSMEALGIWRAARPISGTPAETYLRSRGLHCQLPSSLRFTRLPYGKRGRLHPCLIALIASVDNRAIGIQRTYLNSDGTCKATVPKPKLSLGRVTAGALRLAPAAAEMIVCEGLEDGLTLQQELGTATWVAAGAGNLLRLELPVGVNSVIVGADRDPAGEAAARSAAERFASQGRKVRIIRPMPGFKDFNAELQGVM